MKPYPLERVLGMPRVTRSAVSPTVEWSRKVSVNISPIQASDEGDLILLHTDTQSIFSHPDPVVIARGVQFPNVWDASKILGVRNCFEDLSNSG